jgi:hypothetical protein
MNRSSQSKLRFNTALSLAALLVTSGSLSAKVKETFVAPPPSCASDDSSCLVITESQGYELSEFGSIDFIGVREDSRCPLDVVCFWAGQVQVELKRSFGGEASKFALGLGGELSSTWIDERTGKELVLEEVWPQPNLSRPVNEPYQIKLRVVEPGQETLDEDVTQSQSLLD